VSLPADYTWGDLQTNSFAYSLEEITKTAGVMEGLGVPGMSGQPGARRLLQNSDDIWDDMWDEYFYGYYGYDSAYAPSCTDGPFLTQNETSRGINTLLLTDIGVGASGVTKTLRVVACFKDGAVSEEWDATFSIASPPIVESILTIPLLNSANFDTIAVDAVRTALGKLAFGKDTLAPVDLSRVVLNSSAIQSLNVREKP